MPTFTGSGQSTTQDASKAIGEALTDARSTLGGQAETIGLLFAGPSYDFAELVAAARNQSTATWIGCSTAGEFTEKGLTHNGVALFLISSDDLVFDLGFSDQLKADPVKAATELCRGFISKKKEAFQRKLIRSTTILLTDGLAGTGEVALQKVSSNTSAFQQIVGGAAGDEAQFKATHVAGGEKCASDAMVALHCFSSKIWGVGIGHGLRPNSDKMRVTKAEGNVLYEIDGRPAFEVYKEHAKAHGQELTEANAGEYMIANELGIYFFDRIAKARAPLSVGDDGSLACAGEVPAGASVCILDGDPETMISAAKEAALEAQKNLGQAKAAGVILFDCVCRGMILKDQFHKEIEAVQSVFGNVPITGFLTYGEIARYKGKLGGWHNTTAVVLAIPA